ncbi:hypothetical protein [Crocosphaera sp.]|uniref:hypothetical protein n=1 Tax=Crocosphaera sp. TaxID=2729996 RepID=UPI00260684EC|nr:hypothetical protein [Crocosphaera sp.]MDJ0583256.1 hypothetical protein [Crocosphaera sp.]
MSKSESINIRLVQTEDIETLFEIRTSVKENYQSRQEIAQLGITPASVAKMLQKDCCAWIAEIIAVAKAIRTFFCSLFPVPCSLKI